MIHDSWYAHTACTVVRQLVTQTVWCVQNWPLYADMLLGNGQHSRLNDSMQYTVDILIKALLKQNESIRGLMEETVTNFIVES